MREIWKEIEGYDGKYYISSWGRVKGPKGILTPYLNYKGYEKVGLSKNGKCEKHRVHRLVADAFIPNPYNLPEVNHIDGNKRNNSFSNLEWVTGEENRNHDKIMEAFLIGEQPFYVFEE